MDSEIIFKLITNIIIAQNTELLKKLAKANNLDEKYLLDKYLRPEYYLPIYM